MGSPLRAQGAINLDNGDFEKPLLPSGLIDDWNLIDANSGAVLTTNDTHCGDQAVQVTSRANWCEFGKQKTMTGLTNMDKLRVRFRIKCEDLMGGTLKVKCAGYDTQSTSWWNSPLSGSTQVTVGESRDWQEFVLTLIPTGGDEYASALIRFHVTLSGDAGASYLLDSVDFAGSTGAFSNFQESGVRQVMSTDLSLVYDEKNRSIRELREVGLMPNTSIPVATGPNWLVAKSSNTPDSMNALFKVVSRQTYDSPAAYHNSTNSQFTSTVTPLSTDGISGWRVTSFHTSHYTVTVDIHAANGEPEIHITPVLDRDDDTYFERLDCPNLVFTADQDGDTTPDGITYLSPKAGGALHPLDAPYFTDMGTEESTWQGTVYPGSAALQMMAMYGGSTQAPGSFGIAIQARDEDLHEKQLAVRISKPTQTIPWHHMDSSVRHQLPTATALELGEHRAPSFPRVLVPFRGDWRDAAENYREWVRGTARWSDAAARQTAAWIEERPVVVEANLRPMGIGLELVPLDEWDNVLSEWQAYFAAGSSEGGKLQPLFRAFEQHGTYMAPFHEPLNVLSTTQDPLTGMYLPLRTESEILAEWSQVNGDGHSPMAMIQGLRWAIARPGTQPHCNANGPTGFTGGRGYWVYGYYLKNHVTGFPWDGIVMEDRQGEFVLEQRDANSRHWEFSYMPMDPRHEFTRQNLTSLARTLASGGVRLMQFDQWNGAIIPDNFDQSYEPAGRGAGQWKSLASRKLITAILAAGRSQSDSHEFEVSIEDPTETAIDLIAVHGTRPGHIRVHPAAPYGHSESVPMFGYVFNEVVATTTWDQRLPDPFSAPTANEKSVKLAEIARTLTAGSFMTLGFPENALVNEYYPLVACPTSGPSMAPTPTNMASDMLAFLAVCVRTSQGPAREFLNHGKMVQAEGIDGLGATSIDINGRKVPQPVVHHSAYHLASMGKSALILANATDGPQVVMLPSHLGDQVLADVGMFDLYSDGATETPQAYTPGMPITVQPREVLLLVF
jgi:hypothetical protein